MFKLGEIARIKNESTLIKILSKTEVTEGETKYLTSILKNDLEIELYECGIEKVNKYYINEISNKINVGDLIATNANDTETIANKKYIYGKVGEIFTRNENKYICLWNNTLNGGTGIKERPGKWRYSWLINLDNTEAHIIFEKEKNMRKLKTKEIVKCSSCKKNIEKEECSHEFDGKIWCEECYNQQVGSCSCCEGNFYIDDLLTSEEGDRYCDDCYSENFATCYSCDCELDCHSGEIFTGTDDNVYCSDCFSERFSVCNACGDTFRVDDMRTRESDGFLFCEDCYSEEGSTAEERLIHDYSYKPSPEFKKLKWEKENSEDQKASLFMGLELEVQRDSSEKEASSKLISFLKKEKVEKHYYLKHDGSVPNGFEIVTHPFTLSYAHREMKLNKILRWMKEQEFTSEESGKCGLHIHLSRDFFEDLEITKMRLFFKENEDKLKELSRRKGVGENYCKFETINTKDILNDSSQSGRYWALNLNSSTNTVEIRMFRGTLNPKRITAILQFMEALSYFVKVVGVTSLVIGEREYRKNSWKLFIDWAKDQEKYGTMLKHLKGEKLCA